MKFLKDLGLEFLPIWNEKTANIIFCLNPDGTYYPYVENLELKLEYLYDYSAYKGIPKYIVWPVSLFDGEKVYYFVINSLYIAGSIKPDPVKSVKCFTDRFGGSGIYIPIKALHNYEKRNKVVYFVTDDASIAIKVREFISSKDKFLSYVFRCVGIKDYNTYQVENRIIQRRTIGGSGFGRAMMLTQRLHKWKELAEELNLSYVK